MILARVCVSERKLVWSGDLSVDQFRGAFSGRVAGDYEKAALYFFGASLRWGKQ